MITVTKPYFPPLEQYQTYLKKVWANGTLTNNGPLVQELEENLKKYLNVKHLFFVSNGTIALQIAIKVLGLKNEIITTPFSYVATTNSIIWEGCKPVFADINPVDFNIDPKKIEPLITKETSAILATHVYGNPCDLRAIEEIAKANNCKVIYDAAHAFGSTFKNKQICSFGDIATCSFHATKLFHTIEGGAIITDDDELAEKIMLYRQFGHIGDEYYTIGINGKNSEMHAAMGLCVLPMIDKMIAKRKELSDIYDMHLEELGLKKPIGMDGISYNYSYYPVVFSSEEILLKTKQYLADCSIYTRRYFYPSLNQLPFLKGMNCPVSEDISGRVLALPIYYDLEITEVNTIINYLRKFLKK